MSRTEDDGEGASRMTRRASTREQTAENGPDAAADRTLVQRLLDADEAAFTELVARYHGSLLRLARSFVKEHATAEEVVQETWVGVLRGLPDFSGRSSLKTWIFRILVNQAKTRGVREARSVPFSDLSGADSDVAPAVDPARFRANGSWADPPRRWTEDTPEELLLRTELSQRLLQAIEGLPARQRAVLVLRDIEGVSAQEACGILEITETNQRVILHRARTVLHRVLSRHLDER